MTSSILAVDNTGIYYMQTGRLGTRLLQRILIVHNTESSISGNLRGSFNSTVEFVHDQVLREREREQYSTRLYGE